MFVAELGGDIKIVDLNTNAVSGTFLDITDVDAAGEGGLLGLAFHPDYATPDMPGFGKFYVNVTIDNDLPKISRRSRRASASIRFGPRTQTRRPSSVREILSFTQPQSNHNGGWIGFSPNDNYLYIASGDGGAVTTPARAIRNCRSTGNAQDITNNLLGKMLRIDVNGDDFPRRGPQLRDSAHQSFRRRRTATMRSGHTACATRSAIASTA